MARFLLVALLLGGCGRTGYTPELPELDASADLLRFDAEVGDLVVPQSLSVVDVHGLSVGWRATTSAPWVHVIPDSGRTPMHVQVTVDTRGLRPDVAHRAGISLLLEEEADISGGTSFVVELTLSAPGWQPLDGPYCGHLYSVATSPDDPDRVLGGDLDGRLWVSSDGGQSFFVAASGDAPLHSILLLPGGRGYAATEGVLRTDDGGLTWSGAGLAGVRIDWLAVDPADPNTLLAEGAGLWRSNDGGATWEDADGGLETHCLIADPSAPGRFLVGGSLGEVYTTTGAPGAALNPVTSTGRSQEIYSIAVLPSGRWVVTTDVDSGNPTEVRVSDDAGASWQNPGNAGLADEQGVALWLRVVDGVLYGLNKSLYRSDDGGGIWNPVSVGLASTRGGDRRWYDAVSWNDELLLAHHALGGVQLTTPTPTQLPLFACEVRDLAVDPAGDLYGINNPGGVFARRSGSFAGIAGSGGPYGHEYLALSLDPRTSTSMMVGTYDEGIYRTTDGGASWIRGGVGFSSGRATVIARARDDPDVLWVAAYDPSVARTADNGLSYTALVPRYGTNVAAVSSAAAIYFRGGEIRRVDSAGTISTLLDPSDNTSFVGSTDDGSVWVAHRDDGLYRSTDGGQSFTTHGLSGTHVNDLWVDPTDATHIVGATSLGLFETRDDGATWAELGSPFTPRSLTWDAAVGLLLVGTVHGGIYSYQPD